MKYIVKPAPITKVRVDKSVMTYLMNQGVQLEIATYAWAVEGNGAKILVDTGCPAEVQTQSGFPATQISTLREGLASIGWKPEDVDLVILTHLHFDHIAYAKELANATFIIQEREYTAAFNPHPAYEGFYPVKMLKELLNGLKIERVNGDKEVVNGISVMLTPGHTPGGQTVLIESNKGTIALTGFCCIRENFEPPKGVKGISKNFIIPGIHTNIVELYESMQKIKEASDIIVPIHDSTYLTIKQIP